MDRAHVFIRFAPELTLFLPSPLRDGRASVVVDGTSSLGHVVESLGVPLPEVGRLVVGGGDVAPSYRPSGGEEIEVLGVTRPQPLPMTPPRFLLDVHLGTLTRRLRLLGLDCAYDDDLDDDVLIEMADLGRRVLLTQDRGLLRRRRLWFGAYVRGARPDDQLDDVLERFAPRLSPWTRCVSCNGLLAAVAKSDVDHVLRPGTLRTYDSFARCPACGRVYWHGAHHRRLEAIVEAACGKVAAVQARGTPS